MKTRNILRISVIAIAVAAFIAIVAGTIVLFRSCTKEPEPADGISVNAVRVAEIKSMVRLCALEIYQEVPVKASIGRRHLVASQTIEGQITFDVEHLRIDSRGDTLFVFLPPEQITLRESTRPGAYKVIDTWSDAFLGNGHFTADEENAVKRRVLQQMKKEMYTKGYVREARRTAIASLAALLASAPETTVIVTDPSPDGYPDGSPRDNSGPTTPIKG